MPIKRCQLNGKPGYRWGTTGTCYTYTPGNEADRGRAVKRAEQQGRAIEASKHSGRGVKAQAPWEGRR
jgi:hypothetical protein